MRIDLDFGLCRHPLVCVPAEEEEQEVVGLTSSYMSTDTEPRRYVTLDDVLINSLNLIR